MTLLGEEAIPNFRSIDTLVYSSSFGVHPHAMRLLEDDLLSWSTCVLRGKDNDALDVDCSNLVRWFRPKCGLDAGWNLLRVGRKGRT